ncbi:MAG: cytoplasmic protein [Deltaproteobacteria bacterium]|nr:cytoplasmic protein [Deltaproteobacteria bacterium]
MAADSFGEFNASLLYCNKCGRAMPVRQRLLLVLPDGELYDYTCQACNNSVGSKTEKAGASAAVANPRSRLGGY